MGALPPPPTGGGFGRESITSLFKTYNTECMTKCRMRKFAGAKQIANTIFILLLLFLSVPILAQDGNAGINQANTTVRSYFDAGTNLMYAVGAILGLIGAIKVYQKWSHGDHDTGKVAAAWFGSCIFLVFVATVLKSFFGL